MADIAGRLRRGAELVPDDDPRMLMARIMEGCDINARGAPRRAWFADYRDFKLAWLTWWAMERDDCLNKDELRVMTKWELT